MFQRLFAAAAPWVLTVIGFYLVALSLLRGGYQNPQDMQFGAVLWGAGIILMMISVSRFESAVNVIPTLFLMAVGACAAVAGVVLLVPWALMFAASNVNGSYMDQRLVILMPLAYVVLPAACAFIIARERGIIGGG